VHAFLRQVVHPVLTYLQAFYAFFMSPVTGYACWFFEQVDTIIFFYLVAGASPLDSVLSMTFLYKYLAWFGDIFVPFGLHVSLV
jgi:hypothetical protein